MEQINHIAKQPNDIRFITCLQDSGREHGLIEQLMYYFNSMTFSIPPLRQRQADILLLTIQQLRFIYDEYRVERAVSPKVMTAMLAYDWPGNIRQLTKVIDRMAFMSDTTLMDSISQFESCLSAHGAVRQPAEGRRCVGHLPLGAVQQAEQILRFARVRGRHLLNESKRPYANKAYGLFVIGFIADTRSAWDRSFSRRPAGPAFFPTASPAPARSRESRCRPTASAKRRIWPFPA